MSVNILKFMFWQQFLATEYPKVYYKMDILVQNVMQCNFIDKIKSLVPEISTNPTINNTFVEKKVYQHKLKFEYKWKRWGLAETEKLLKFICDQKSNWVFNEESLQEIFEHFEKRFSHSKLKRKCIQYGLDFEFVDLC